MSRFTIDELAQRSGVSSRNIRAWQGKNLLPPPDLEGRTGYYNEGHLSRLKFIGQMQERGYSLAAIADLVKAWEGGQDLGGLLGLEGALTLKWTDEEARHVSKQELLSLFPGLDLTPELLDKAEEAGLFASHGKGFLAPSPRLLLLAQVVYGTGMTMPGILNILTQIQNDLSKLAAQVVHHFVTGIWEPLKAEGQPPEGLLRMGEGIQKLRDVTPPAMAGILSKAIEREITSAAIRDLQGRLPGKTE